MPTKPKLSLTQTYLIMLALGILTGSAVFIWKNSSIFPTMILYHELNTDRLLSGITNSTGSSHVSVSGLLSYVFEKRLQQFAILLLTQITLIRKQAACFYSLAYGFCSAILEGFYVQQYGLCGLLLFLLTLIPHILFYGLAWHTICTRRFPDERPDNTALIKYTKILITYLLFIFAGIISESTLNLFILKFFYMLFL